MASDATKQTINQSLIDLKAEVADRTKSIITGVKIPELEDTRIISNTDQLIIETGDGTKRTTMRAFGDFVGTGLATPKEVQDARGNYPQLGDRLDAMDNKIVTNEQNIQNNAQGIQNNEQEIQGNKQEITNLKNKQDTLSKEVEEARKDNKTPNTTHNSLKERLDSDFDHLNSEIEKTNTQLSELEEHILDIKKLPNNLNLHRLGRKFYPETSNSYCNSQAMCCIDDKIIVQSYQLFGGNDIKLIKMNIETGQELFESVVPNGYHCNGMCYNTNDGFIYFTPAHNQDVTQTFKTVSKVDKNTLNIVETIDLTAKTNLTYVASVAYDEIKNQFIVNHDNNFEVYDSNWNYVKSFTIHSTYKERRYQTITANKGKLYQITSAPETIWIYDLIQDKLLKTIVLDSWQDLYYNLGELEGMSFNPVNGDIYLTSQSRYTEKTGGGLTQFWWTRLDTNAPQSNNTLNFQRAQQETVVFANAANANYNPTGQYNNPYPTLSEACTALASPYAGNRVLTLLSNFDETLMITSNLSGLVVNGGENFSIKALILLYASNVYIPVLRLTGISSYNNNGIYLYMSELTTTGIHYTAPQVPPTYYTLIERSKFTAPKSFLNATDINHFMKNSKVYVHSKMVDKLKYANLIKENENNYFSALKWSNGGGNLTDTVTLPTDWRLYRNAKIVFRFDGRAEIFQDTMITNDAYTIRLSAVYQTDNNELYNYSAWLKLQNNTYTLGAATGASFINGVWTRIDSPTVVFDIAFYD